LGLSAAVQPLLAPDTDAASSGGKGEGGGYGDFLFDFQLSGGAARCLVRQLLIKQVVEKLKLELPRIEQFATLSPVPGFRRWLDKNLPELDPTLDADPARR